jgi:hypothetical protein
MTVRSKVRLTDDDISKESVEPVRSGAFNSASDFTNEGPLPNSPRLNGANTSSRDISSEIDGETGSHSSDDHLSVVAFRPQIWHRMRISDPLSFPPSSSSFARDVKSSVVDH